MLPINFKEANVITNEQIDVPDNVLSKIPLYVGKMDDGSSQKKILNKFQRGFLYIYLL